MIVKEKLRNLHPLRFGSWSMNYYHILSCTLFNLLQVILHTFLYPFFLISSFSFPSSSSSSILSLHFLFSSTYSFDVGAVKREKEEGSVHSVTLFNLYSSPLSNFGPSLCLNPSPSYIQILSLSFSLPLSSFLHFQSPFPWYRHSIRTMRMR